ncbi:MAG: NYN domain-containing protein [Nanoarchaeota archaeon]
MSEKERVAIFIDGSNLYHSLKKYKIKYNFEKIISKLENKREIVNIFYYTALLDKYFDEEKYKNHLKFLEKLKRIPKFNIVLCNLKKIILKDGSVTFAIKGDDVCLTTDIISGAYENLYDIAILVSGDEDFVPAIKAVQKIGKRVINAFFPKSSSYILRNYCNDSINLRKELI